jgi:hypothetical protein
MEEFTHAFFDDASTEFMRGKIKEGYMIYYKCTLCDKKAVQDVFAETYLCKTHTNKQKQKKKEHKVLPPVESRNEQCQRRSPRIAAKRQHCRVSH